MGVEQDGLGVRVLLGELYEVECGGVRAQGNAGSPHEGPPSRARGLLAGLGAFVAVELQRGAGDLVAGGRHCRSLGIHEQEHGRYEGGQAARERGGALHGHRARAFRIQHESHRIGAGLDGGVQVLLAGDAADLDARAGGWGVAAPAVRLGRVRGG